MVDDDTRTGKENEKFGTLGNEVLIKTQTLFSVNLAEERVENEDFKVIYQGWAVIGSGEAEAVWLISKLIYVGGVFSERRWADGEGTFNKIWNDRDTYSYSY